MQRKLLIVSLLLNLLGLVGYSYYYLFPKKLSDTYVSGMQPVRQFQVNLKPVVAAAMHKNDIGSITEIIHSIPTSGITGNLARLSCYEVLADNIKFLGTCTEQYRNDCMSDIIRINADLAEDSYGQVLQGVTNYAYGRDTSLVPLYCNYLSWGSDILNKFRVSCSLPAIKTPLFTEKCKSNDTVLQELPTITALNKNLQVASISRFLNRLQQHGITVARPVDTEVDSFCTQLVTGYPTKVGQIRLALCPNLSSDVLDSIVWTK